jgi:hypothetical protein
MISSRGLGDNAPERRAGTEMEQQSDLAAAGTEVIEQLVAVRRHERRSRFDLDDDPRRDEEVRVLSGCFGVIRVIVVPTWSGAIILPSRSASIQRIA